MRKGFNSTFASHAVHISARNKAVIRRLRERANLLLSRDAMLPHSPSRPGRKLGRKGREGARGRKPIPMLFSILPSFFVYLALPPLPLHSVALSLSSYYHTTATSVDMRRPPPRPVGPFPKKRGEENECEW